MTETDPSCTYKIKYPLSIRVMISMSVLIILYSIRTIGYVEFGLLVFSSCVLILSVVRALLKPTEMLLTSETIVVSGRKLESGMIKAIMIQGYFRPVIGIKPKGKWIVPLKLCFRFVDDEDNAIQMLSEWAKKNKIQVDKRSFMKWM